MGYLQQQCALLQSETTEPKTLSRRHSASVNHNFKITEIPTITVSHANIYGMVWYLRQLALSLRQSAQEYGQQASWLGCQEIRLFTGRIVVRDLKLG